jgi:guanylate kinase
VPSVADSSVFVLIGPGGVGKGTVARILIDRDSKLWLSRSWTSRAIRPSEKGSEYVFVDRPTFEEAITQDRFYEWAEFHGNLYGTPIPNPPAGTDVLLEIEVQGAAQVKSRHPKSTVILLLPPSLEELESRLRARGDTDDHVQLRLGSSDFETSVGREIADYVVTNHTLDETIIEILGILESVRQSRD